MCKMFKCSSCDTVAQTLRKSEPMPQSKGECSAVIAKLGGSKKTRGLMGMLPSSTNADVPALHAEGRFVAGRSWNSRRYRTELLG